MYVFKEFKNADEATEYAKANPGHVPVQMSTFPMISAWSPTRIVVCFKVEK